MKKKRMREEKNEEETRTREDERREREEEARVRTGRSISLFQIRSIVLSPTDTPKNLRDIIRDRLTALGNPLIAWVPSNVFVWKKESSKTCSRIPFLFFFFFFFLFF
jgi:hypothetical protein